MKKNLYVISDIHGYFNEMKDSLEKSGFLDDDNSLLIVCGDLFDRGEYSKEIYYYLRDLQSKGKAIITKGNHDNMFIEFLRGEDCWFNFMHNGMNKTLDSFLDRTASFESFIIIDSLLSLGELDNDEIDKLWNEYQNNARETILSENEGILDWFESLPDYYETKNYIFTHGSIDTEAKDWHFPEFSKYQYVSWDACHWDDGSFFKKDIKNTDKTVVVGHYHTDGIRAKYNMEYDGTNKILTRDDGKIIMIDTCTPITKRVNVLTIENEELL